MRFNKDNLYHIYNRGNNKQQIYFSNTDYLNFLQKINENIKPYCNILAWCLMPNHFHLLIFTNEQTIIEKKIGGLILQNLICGIKQLLSSYTKSINKKYNRTGNLFQQKTKAKQINNTSKINYALICFHYIHQNPWRAELANKIEDWEFSSFKDYMELRNGKLCNKNLAKELLDIDVRRLYEESYQLIPANYTKEFD
ncbi:MAG: transposase [Chitinophagaceae bacterium]